MAKKEEQKMICHHHGFPWFMALVFVLSVLWLLEALGVFSLLGVDKIPWIPTILVVWSLGAIVHHYTRK